MVNSYMVMSGWSITLTTLFLGSFRSPKLLTSISSNIGKNAAIFARKNVRSSLKLLTIFQHKNITATDFVSTITFNRSLTKSL